MRVAQLERLDGSKDLRRCYFWTEFDVSKLSKKTITRKGKKIPHKYLKNIATFDIESTTIKCERPYGFMYIWTMALDDYSVYGYTWSDFESFLQKLVDYFETTEDKRLIIWVQNLSFEMQFMTPFLIRTFNELEVFATDTRKPIKLTCTASGLEFRCTYRLSNMALDAMCKFEKGMVHRKLVGDLDYNKKRLPAVTPMTIREFSYCISDTVTLKEWVEAILKNNNDTFFTMPVTSTGYVRRDCRIATKKERGYRNFFVKNWLVTDVYILLKEAGRGGNTHANRVLANRILEGLDSWDLVSSYIYSLLARKYPVTKFSRYGRVDSEEELLALAKKYALIFRCVIVNPRVKDNVPFPYLPISKKTSLSGSIVNDNGRVLRVNGEKGALGSIGYTFTDIDFDIFKREYDYDAILIYDVYIARRGYLPKSLRDAIKSYFIKKCELKEKIKAAEDWLEELKRQHKEHTKAYQIHKQELEDYKYLYDKMKNRLNGIFGMAYTDVCRLEYKIDPETGDWIKPNKLTEEDITKALDEYNNSYNSFLVYAHGVFCTAWSRLSFEELTEACNNRKYGNVTVYGDTDSNKAIINDETPLLEFNKRVMKLCDKTGAYCVVNGNKYYLGIAEKETKKEKYQKFKTMGAKKYCYFDSEGLHVTVSGVVKDLAPKELKSVENFEKGFVFRKAGGKTLFYNDEEIHTIEVDGVEIETASNIGMVESTYTLGLTTDYERILSLYYAEGF